MDAPSSLDEVAVPDATALPDENAKTTLTSAVPTPRRSRGTRALVPCLHRCGYALQRCQGQCCVLPECHPRRPDELRWDDPVANVQRFGCSVEVSLSGVPERTASLISIVVPRAQRALPFSIRGGSWGPVILLE